MYLIPAALSCDWTSERGQTWTKQYGCLSPCRKSHALGAKRTIIYFLRPQSIGEAQMPRFYVTIGIKDETVGHIDRFTGLFENSMELF